MKNITFARQFALFLLAAMLAACATAAPAPEAGHPVQKASSDQIVLLIGLDGLRADAIDRFPDAAPNLRALAGEGVRASGMTPTMPSVTFVNFYTLATGLYAEHTGIVSNLSYSLFPCFISRRL